MSVARDLQAHQLAPAALELAAEGFRVFPCHTTASGGCSCGSQCTSPGKHPRTAKGFKDATTDARVITAWWERWPDANIGVATGRGLLVVDVDGIEAQAALDALASEHGHLPATRAVATGREGGQHLWFRLVANEPVLPNSSGRLGKGIDTRGEGGYVLAPPSLHATGQRYRWKESGLGSPPALLPAWILERLTTPSASVANGQGPTHAAPPDPRRVAALGDAVLGRELDALAAHSSEPGTGRGTALFGTAGRLGRIVAAGGLDLMETWQALESAGHSLGLEQTEIDRNIERGLEFGMAQPLELSDRPRTRRDERRVIAEPSPAPAADEASEEGWSLRPRSIPPPFPVEALGDEIAAFVTALATQTQTAPDLGALGALGALSSVALPAKVDCGNWEEETLSLYILAVSPSGDRKSTVLKKVAAPLYRIEHEAHQAAKSERIEHEARRDLLKERKQALTKRAGNIEDEDERASAQAELEQVARELAEVSEFVEPRLLTADATPEGLAELLADHHDGIAVLSAESAVIDNLLGHYSDKGKANLHVVCEAYTADYTTVDRRGRPALIIPRPLLGITLFAQPFVLENVLAHGTARGQGLIGRFVLVDASGASYIGRRQIDPPPPAVPQYLHEAWERIVRKVKDACRCDRTDKRGGSVGSVGSVAPLDVPFLTLTLSPSSKKLLTAVEVQIEPRQADGADLATYRDWVARHHGRVARIAALLHLAERAPDEPIAVDTMRRALRIGDYILEHGLLAMSAPDELTRRALVWLSRREEPTVSLRDIHHDLLGGHVKKERAEALIRALVDEGALRAVADDEAPNPKGGRPKSPRYTINPDLRGGR